MIKKLILTESDFHKIIENSVKLMLQEELLLEDSRINPVKRIIRQALGNTYNLDAVVDSEDKYVNHNPNTTWLKYFIFKLRHSLAMMSNSDYPYLALAARLAFSDEVRLDKKNEASEEVEMLKKIMNLIKNDNALFQEVNSNPNITFGQLANRFQQQFEAEKNADSEAANKVEVTDNGYEILEVPDFETAKYYRQFTCSQSQLCYTRNEHIWNSYTDGGLNTAYICLKRGWEDVPEVATEGNPYDTYGLSMIFAFISPKGELVRSNCRWNHYNKGPYIDPDVDKAFTETSLAQTVGAPFKSVFKSNYESRTNEKLIELVEQGYSCILIPYLHGDFVIPEGTKKIGEFAFWLSEVTSVKIPNTIEIIEPYAFSECNNLTNITIPDSVTSIHEYVFSKCNNITSITIGNRVTSIGNYAFTECQKLESIVIPNSVTEIGRSLFKDCINLKNVEIPSSIKIVEYGLFDGCKSLTSIKIPEGITEIGPFAFFECANLTSVTLPSTIKKVDTSSFMCCHKDLVFYAHRNIDEDLLFYLKFCRPNFRMEYIE